VTQILSGDIGNILNFVAAAAGLGTAAMGLVDASKAFGGGPSNLGFEFIERAVKPFLAGTPEAATAFDQAAVVRTLKANWLNGVAKADQKAKAKALIHLGLTPGNAVKLAEATGVSGEKLQALAEKTAGGGQPSTEEINVLGQFDVILSAMLDDAYERADQKYRNASKLLAMAVATVLGGIGGWLVFGIASWYFPLSIIVGLSATPLAPVAKDLTTALQAAAGAVGTLRR
jgi:hypothetical protein